MTHIAPSRARIFSTVFLGVSLAAVFIFAAVALPAHADYSTPTIIFPFDGSLSASVGVSNFTAPIFSPNGTYGTGWVDSSTAQALYFDGSSGDVFETTSTAAENNGIAINVWANYGTLGTRPLTSIGPCELYYNGSANSFFWNDHGSSHSLGVSINAGEWHMYTIEIGSTTTQIWIDHNEVYDAATYDTSCEDLTDWNGTPTPVYFRFGDDSQGFAGYGRFLGYAQELTIWLNQGTPLAQTDIDALWNGGNGYGANDADKIPSIATSSLGQYHSDGTTPINEGSGTTESTVVFKAGLLSASMTDELELQVQVQPAGTPFDDTTVTATSAAVIPGNTGLATVSGLANGTYHWQVRAYDATSRHNSAWQPLSSSTADFVVGDGLAQTSPVVLEDATTTFFENNQYSGGCCGGTVLGHVFYHAPESFPIQSVQVSLTDSSVNNHDGAGGIQALIYDTDGNLIASSTNGIYAESSCGSCSFHFNGERIPQDFEFVLLITSDLQGSAVFSIGDFRFVALPPLEIISGTLGQFQSDGATAITEGGTTPENTVTFGAELASTGTSTVQFQVELEPSSTPFTDAPNAASVFVGPGTFAYATSSVLADGGYHWQARVMDAGNNTSTWQFFGSGQIGTDFRVHEVPILSEQPDENPICPGISSSVTHLVFITHGWRDNATDPTGWVQEMKSLIQSRLPDSSWGVCTYDWSGSALAANPPWTAFNNATEEGLFVGAALAQQNYASIHFIAHSAGAELIQTAAELIRNKVPAQAQPKIQLTFLDAYDPSGASSVYGQDPKVPNTQYNSDTGWWAEQDVDMRFETFPFLFLDNTYHFLGDTNIKLANAYNFDVTALDPDQSPEPPFDPIDYILRVHDWPYVWYTSSTIASNAYTYGFPLSLEAGNADLPIQYNPGGYCQLTSENTVCPNASTTLTQFATSSTDPFDFTSATALGNAETSITGTFTYPDANSVIFGTDSPVWLKVSTTTAEDFDVIKFDYQFLSASGSQGIASVEVDNQPVYKIDERVTPPGVNEAEDVWVGNLAPGPHTISFRLDPYTSVQSVLEISNLEFGLKREQQVMTDTTAPTTTTMVSGTQGLSGWYTSDVSVALDAADNPGGVGVKQTTYSLDNSPVQVYSTSTPISITTEGTHILQYSSVDFLGNQEATNTLSIKIDKAPPTIFRSAVAPSTLLNASAISFTYSATDTVSGVAVVTATLDGQEIPASTTISFAHQGNHTIVISASDLAGNAATTTIDYTIAYAFGGFQSPIKTDGSGIYNLGRTLPIKFSLTDANGNAVANAVAQLVVTNVQNGIVGTVPVELATSTNDTGNLFRISANQYVYNFDTGQLTTGTWQIRAALDDGNNYPVLISLR